MATNADASFSDEQREWLGRLFLRQDESSPSTSSSGAGRSLDPPPSTDPSTGELLQGCREKSSRVQYTHHCARSGPVVDP